MRTRFRYTLLYILPLLAVVISFTTSCRKTVRPTSVIVLDSVRHYFPIIQGEEMTMSFRIANVGKEPLVLTDVMPSCGCIAVDENLKKVVLPGKETKLYFKFNSSKYSGYVSHKIRLFGNIKPKGIAVISFDINVVPLYGSAPDYEELFRQQIATNPNANPSAADKSYWVDEDAKQTNSRKFFMDLDNKK